MLNINVGLLGHVDSGKTALAKALSQTASTAAFDKSPQSQSRGITLDLGFSACEVLPSTPGCADVLAAAGLDRVLCTLVDCPGHASLIRTVVGGAQIIDVMVLLVDATKGFQQQTAECLVLGEVLARPLVVVINKIDAVQGNSEAEQAATVARLRRKLAATFARTRWPRVPMVEVAAAPRRVSASATADGGSQDGVASVGPPLNTAAVLPAVLSVANLADLRRRRDEAGNEANELAEQQKFMMLVDHCFAVRGQGTVFTGTVLGGLVRVGDSILVPTLREVRKVKSLQVFHKSVPAARAGDRVGLCVSQFEAAQMERGVLCAAPSTTAAAALHSASAATGGPPPPLELTDTLIARVHRVRFHPLPCDSHTKFHVTVGHTTTMGTMRYFSRPTDPACATDARAATAATPAFDPAVESQYEDELPDDACLAMDSAGEALAPGQPVPERPTARTYYAILLLETPVFVTVGATLVAMRLDVERENFCRIAVAGRVVARLPSSSAGAASGAVPAWRTLPIVRHRRRELRVDRVLDARTCIADGVVLANVDNTVTEAVARGRRGHDGPAQKDKDTMHAEAHRFVGLRVEFVPAGEEREEGDEGSERDASLGSTSTALVAGVIESTFGKTGKVRLAFQADVFAVSSVGGRRKGSDASAGQEVLFLRPGAVFLPMKKYPLALHSRIHQ